MQVCSNNSLDNRNLIVNVQVMGKKQEIITYQSKLPRDRVDFKQPFPQRRSKANNYVLACSEDREIQTHRESSRERSLLNDYHNQPKSKHKKTQSQERTCGWRESFRIRQRLESEYRAEYQPTENRLRK